MENIFNEIQQACKDAGTNLTRVCRAAKIRRATPERWKDEDPKSVVIYKKLMREIEIQKAKNSPEDDAC